MPQYFLSVGNWRHTVTSVGAVLRLRTMLVVWNCNKPLVCSPGYLSVNRIARNIRCSWDLLCQQSMTKMHNFPENNICIYHKKKNSPASSLGSFTYILDAVWQDVVCNLHPFCIGSFSILWALSSVKLECCAVSSDQSDFSPCGSSPLTAWVSQISWDRKTWLSFLFFCHTFTNGLNGLILQSYVT